LKFKRLAVLALLLLAGIALLIAARGPAAPIPAPSGTFSFAVLGDAPYYFFEDWQYRLVLDELAANELAAVIHVGDIFWRPCTDELYRRSLGWFNELPHPVIYTPGDNEWTDCWERGSGRYAPLERLERLREVFFAEPGMSLGSRPIPVDSQDEYVENVRWRHGGLVFATVHLVGSWNGMAGFDGRTRADDEAVVQRTEAAAAWLRETFAEAESNSAEAVVLAFHGNPAFENPVIDRYRRTYEPFLEALEEEAERFGKPVLLTHGDYHEYSVDRPFVRRSDGRRLDNVVRMQVPGSPNVGWVRVTVTPGADEPFAFREHVVPHWKFF
jgi:hypothetical protein